MVLGVRSLKGEWHCRSVAGQSGRPSTNPHFKDVRLLGSLDEWEMSKPIASDAWENGRWKVEWREMPAFGPGNLPLAFSRRHPGRCLGAEGT